VSPSVENAYQAAKAHAAVRDSFVICQPWQVKRLERSLHCADWNERRVDAMRALLADKFAAGTPLAMRLLVGVATTHHSCYTEKNGDVFHGRTH